MNPLFGVILIPIVKVIVDRGVELLNDWMSEDKKPITKIPDNSTWTTSRKILLFVMYSDFSEGEKVLGIKVCSTFKELASLINEIMISDKSVSSLSKMSKKVSRNGTIINIANKRQIVEVDYGTTISALKIKYTEE